MRKWAYAVVLLALAAVMGGPADAAAEKPPAEIIGTSVQGRAIVAYCSGEGETVLFIGGMHTGPEANTSSLAWWALENLEGDWPFEVCFIPELNPDGIVLGSHDNARGVDLNRNWPDGRWKESAFHPVSLRAWGGPEPLSEPETQALARFLQDRDVAFVGVLHCCGALVEANDHPLAIAGAQAYATAAGYSYLAEWTAYPITGQFIDWAERRALPAIDIELSRTTSADAIENLKGTKALLAFLALQYHVSPADVAEMRQHAIEGINAVEFWWIAARNGRPWQVLSVLEPEQRARVLAVWVYAPGKGTPEVFIPGAPESSSAVISTLKTIPFGSRIVVGLAPP